MIVRIVLNDGRLQIREFFHMKKLSLRAGRAVIIDRANVAYEFLNVLDSEVEEEDDNHRQS